MNEETKYQIIKELTDHSGNKKRAAAKLGISVRQVNRLINVYKEKGKAGFIHGNRGRLPANSLPQELRNKIVTLYQTKYQGYNFRHYKEKLSDWEDITVSYKTIYTILTANGIFPPEEHRITKKNRAKQKLLEQKPDISEQDLDITVSHQIAIEDAHPRKPRAKYFGEEVQMDASIHLWFGASKSALHLAIDNATGNVLGGCFDFQETLHGYYVTFSQILKNHGIPVRFLTDNRTVFNYESKKKKHEEDDVLTQFGYACRTLGVELETSSVSQYKGQIERANGTFQRRLVNELKTHGITDIDEANRYLTEVFIPDFNRKFAIPVDSFESVMEASPTQRTIDLTLAVLATRVFDSGSAIKYQNMYYQAYDDNDQLVCFKNKTKCLVIKAMDGSLYVTVDEQVYALRPLIRNKEVSETFDIPQPVQKPKKTYIPPMTHPWRRVSFEAQQKRAHQFHLFT